MQMDTVVGLKEVHNEELIKKLLVWCLLLQLKIFKSY